ncbi:MAG: type IV toxin-antitoxin system AbiEi family antitoxin domain-containing protein [Acidobacteriota bacterium]|nr:type IV toxin-antitoxin system AbiEi family antitoxin domain-containing protein [Acidobacteriota bacterium]
MTESERPSDTPDWDSLFDIAQAQAGYFTTEQAAHAGYSPQLLAYHRDNKVERVRRGIYRLVHFPASDHEDLVVLWLWSEQEGVFSHETALALHDLSDILPSRAHLTLPASWRRRRLRVPSGLVLSFADIGDEDRASFEAVPVTRPLRTLRDCIEAHVEPRLVEQAIRQARWRGLISATDETRLLDKLLSVGKAIEP